MRQLRIDWNGLHSAFQMNMPEVKCFLDNTNGNVVKIPPGDQQLGEVRSQPQRYIAIEAVPSRIQYQWLDGFIRGIEDEALRHRMEAAINGKGAFRRFKDILNTDQELRRQWFEYRDLAMRQRIVEWIKELGIDAEDEPDWEFKGRRDHNKREDVEALRDLLIGWFEGKDATSIKPQALEELAGEIGQKFRLKTPSQ